MTENAHEEDGGDGGDDDGDGCPIEHLKVVNWPVKLHPVEILDPRNSQ